MSNQVSFRPELKKATSKGNGVTEVLLIVNNGSLLGKKDDLDALLGKTVSVMIQPETVEYSLPVNKQTKRPNVKYIVNNDGTVEVQKEEQTSLDVGDEVEEVENQTIQISKELVDEFITKATSLPLPDDITINPRDVISRINAGEDLGEIAESYEMSDAALINQIEAARQHFAPFANEWDKKKDEVVFTEPEPADDEEPEKNDNEENENEESESGNETADSDTEATDSGTAGEENADAENDDQSGEDDPEDDPYK